MTSARWAELNNILEEKLISKIYFWQKKSNSPDRGCDIEANFFGKKNFFILILFALYIPEQFKKLPFLYYPRALKFLLYNINTLLLIESHTQQVCCL